MSATAFMFPQWAQGAASKYQNLSADSIYVALSNATGPITKSSTGVQAAKTWSDYKSNVAAEITGTGYTAGGQVLSGVSLSTTGNVFTLTCSNPQWTSATFTANQAIFYDSTASTEQLICCWDFGGSVPVTAGTFLLTVNASGLFDVTAS